jgi:hypothetical protein
LNGFIKIYFENRILWLPCPVADIIKDPKNVGTGYDWRRDIATGFRGKSSTVVSICACHKQERLMPGGTHS